MSKKKAVKRVVIATKQDDIDLFNNRINIIKGELQSFLNSYNELDLGELLIKDFKGALENPKKHIHSILDSKITEVPTIAGLTLSKDKLLDMVDINYSVLENSGAYISSLIKKHRIDLEIFYSIKNSIITINEEEVKAVTDRFVTYAETIEEETLYNRLTKLKEELNSFNEFIKGSNVSGIDLTGITGQRVLGDYFKYNNERKAYEVPLHSFSSLRQYVNDIKK